MPNVTIGAYNTIAITAVSGVYRLTWPSGFTRTIDVMNVGAGAISIRADADPTVNGANTLQLPSNYAINGLKVDGTIGLGVIAAADTTISVRMT